MIPVARPEEPSQFDAECRQPGQAWLAENPDRDPHENPLWRHFTGDLRTAFGNRCGFSAMYVSRGTVDHWISVKSDRSRSYEWTNYRFVDAAVNSAKKPGWEGKLMDPFEVQDGWFEVQLPSLQLVATSAMDPATRARAEFTLKKLRLEDGEDSLRLRREWLAMYESGEISLEGLFRVAPLIARAVAKRDGLSDPGVSRAAQGTSSPPDPAASL